MPSNHTQNYSLNQWEKSDKVLMEDFNADNAKIDAALAAHGATLSTHTAQIARLGNCRVETFRYTGNGKSGESAPTVLQFSARPAFIIVIGNNLCFIDGLEDGDKLFVGSWTDNNISRSGLATCSYAWSAGCAKLWAADSDRQMNQKNTPYRAVAFIPAG